MLQNSPKTRHDRRGTNGQTNMLCPPRRILVADGDPGARTLLCRLLREHGYDATGIADATELARALETQATDLVLLDTLPGLEGRPDAYPVLRKDSPVPIIILSERREESDIVAGLDQGADDYIVKPFGRQEVLARVRTVLRRAGAPQHGARRGIYDIC